MPKIDRPGYERFELHLPESVAAAARTAADRKGQSLTAWICEQIAKSAGVRYTHPRPGRPRSSGKAS